MRRSSFVGRGPAQAVLALVLLFVVGCSTASLPRPPVQAVSLWDDSVVPTTASHSDGRSVDVGLRLTALTAGRITALRVYRGASSSEVLPAWVQSEDGKELGGGEVGPTSAAGWQLVTLATPVGVTAGQTVIAAYRADDGSYPVDVGWFTAHSQTHNASLQAQTGVFRYDPSVPFASWRGTNYWVDVVFEPAGMHGTTEAPSASDVTEKAVLREVDGSPGYYGRFEHGLPTSADFFPVGVWFEEVTTDGQAGADRAAGINLYVELTASSKLSVVRSNGMYALPSRGTGDETTVGTLLTDEADMWGGPGDARWTGKYPGQGAICAPPGGRCGYSIMEDIRSRAPRGSMTLANYGKGVLFWETDKQAARFVNEFQDVVSTDAYWFTDPNICVPSQGGALGGAPEGQALDAGRCRSAANYGRTVDRVRRLVQPEGSKPVWAFVEVGHPASEPDAPTITGPQIRAAAWSALIHGARGIVYFNHSFGGGCISQHVLRDQCGRAVRGSVTATNKQIARLAPVLNAPFVDGLVTATPGVDVATKLVDGDLYVIAGSTSSEPQQARFAIMCPGLREATVVDEERSVPLDGRRFSDEFVDGNAVHIYHLRGGERCLGPSTSTGATSR